MLLKNDECKASQEAQSLQKKSEIPNYFCCLAMNIVLGDPIQIKSLHAEYLATITKYQVQFLTKRHNQGG